MPYNAGYSESIRRSMYRSFQFGGKNGPTLYQGDDISYATPKEGDLWVQTDPAGLQQYTSGSWSAIAAGGGGVSPTDVSNAITASLTNLNDPQVLHVSKTFTSGDEDGSVDKPFSTIQAAHDWAVANVPEGTGKGVVILVHPGAYAGNITITRRSTHIHGFNGLQAVTAISGTVTINLSNNLGNWTNNRVSLENIQITSTANNAKLLYLTGSNPIGLHCNRVKIFSNVAGQTLVTSDNTVSGGVRIEFETCDIQTSSTGKGFDLTNVAAGSFIRRTIGESNSANYIHFKGGSINIEDSFMGTTGNGAVAFLVDGGTVNFQRNTLYSTGTNNDGISIASGAIVGAGGNVLNVSTGTGFAVRGVSGATYMSALNLYQANNKVSSAMGAGIVAIPTTYTTA